MELSNREFNQVWTSLHLKSNSSVNLSLMFSLKRQVPLWITCVLCLMLPLNVALGNEGFYQGSGSVLSPVNNSSLRVRAERLVIKAIFPPKCYSVYANGHPIKEEGGQEISQNANVALGPKVTCRNGNTQDLKVKWFASANYEVEALQSQSEVQIGFPVSVWEREYVDSIGMGVLYVPAVAAFHTFVNDVEIQHLERKVLKSGTKNQRAQSGYVWKTSFEQGKFYQLRTDYEYGEFNSNGYYEGREFQRGLRPWFISGATQTFGAGTMLYFLTPLQTWASPPPDSIDIEVHLPPAIPVTYAVFQGVKPVCLSNGIVYYSFHNKLPDDDMRITLPVLEQNVSENLKPLHTPLQWKMWMATLSNAQTKIECSVTDQIKKGATPELQTLIDNFSCVSSCQAR